MTQNLYDATCDARDELYASIGEVDPDVIAHLVNPAFMGGPAWPALRQAFSIIHRDGNTMVISNGLADPFDDKKEKNSGFNIEIYAETNEEIEGNIAESSVFKLVYATAQQAAHSGQVASFVEQYGVITMELFADDCGLHQFQNENGMVGIMIGVEHPETPKKVEFPGGEVILASVQILTPCELEYVAEARAAGRNSLHEKFRTSGQYHFLSSNRPSLIEQNAAEPRQPEQPVEVLPDEESGKNPWWKFW
jgi:hypothetical protein